MMRLALLLLLVGCDPCTPRNQSGESGGDTPRNITVMWQRSAIAQLFCDPCIPSESGTIVHADGSLTSSVVICE